MQDATAGTPPTPFPDVVLDKAEPPKPKPVDPGSFSLPKIPGVVGMAVADAQALLEQRGYVVATTDVVATDVAPGTVVGQDPRAGVRAAPGATVTLRVATGATLVDVPNVLGLGEAEATRTLQDAGFDVAVLFQEGHPPDAVWAQSPGGGTRAVRGSTVQIWLSHTAESTTTTVSSTTSTPP
jgi:serine/threonine-protein kinase